MKRMSSLAIPILLIVTSAGYAAEPTSACIEQVLARDLPSDIFVGVTNDRRTFIRPRDGGFGLSKSAIAIFDNTTSAIAIRQCNANAVVVWRPETYGKFPEYIFGRVYDKNIKPQTNEFRITESDESQWEFDVAPLLDDAFVVTWKSDTATAGQAAKSGVRIRARVFQSNGVPKSKSFTVSMSQGNQGQARVAGLPNGDFVVAWSLFGSGIYLRIFGKDGSAKTDQILVIKEDDPSRGYVPYIYVTRDGRINLFLRYFYDLNESTPFRVARSFHSGGEALTEILVGDSITALTGYQESVERFVRENAHQLEYRMREHLQKDVMGFRFCDFGLADVGRASKLKTFSKNDDMKRFFTAFCQEHMRSCKPPAFPKHKLALEQCAQSD